MLPSQSRRRGHNFHIPPGSEKSNHGSLPPASPSLRRLWYIACPLSFLRCKSPYPSTPDPAIPAPSTGYFSSEAQCCNTERQLPMLRKPEKRSVCGQTCHPHSVLCCLCSQLTPVIVLLFSAFSMLPQSAQSSIAIPSFPLSKTGRPTIFVRISTS